MAASPAASTSFPQVTSVRRAFLTQIKKPHGILSGADDFADGFLHALDLILVQQTLEHAVLHRAAVIHQQVVQAGTPAVATIDHGGHYFSQEQIKIQPIVVSVSIINPTVTYQNSRTHQ